MKKKTGNILKKPLALLLILSMLSTGYTVPGFGAEIAVSENQSAAEAAVEVSENQSEAEPEEEVSENQSEAEPEEEVPAEESVPETEKVGASEFVSAELSKEKSETAQILKAEAKKLEGLVAGEDYVENEACFLAKDQTEALKVAGEYGAELKSFSEGVAVIVFPEKQNTLQVFSQVDVIASSAGITAEEVEALPDTPVYANLIYHIDVKPEDDPLYRTNGKDISGQWFHAAIDTKGAWDKGADGAGVTVAVIDTGIDTSNNDLKNGTHIKALYTASFSSGEDENGHGTHCSGIVAGLDNTLGGLGVAPEAGVVSIRAGDREGHFTGSDIVEAINKAINENVDVISMSFGGYASNELISQRIKEAIKKGIVCVAAAGNDATSAKSYPANYDGVISVGAYDYTGALAYYSNYGDWVTLAAPGSDIYSTMPDDPSVYLRKEEDAFVEPITDGCSYGMLDGTSMACPVVAGVAALVKGVHPDYSVNDIKDALVDSAYNKTYKSVSGTVQRGINASEAVGEVYSAAELSGTTLNIKQGKKVDLTGLTRIMDTGNLTYSCEGESGIAVSDKGVVSVTKQANVGAKANVIISSDSQKETIVINVIAADTQTGVFTLRTEDGSLSSVKGVGKNSASITMEGGDANEYYRYVVAGKGIAAFKNRKTITLAKGNENVTIYAKKAGTATVTAYALDGSNLKKSIKVKCVNPIKDVKITFSNVPIEGNIRMAKGGRLQLKPRAETAPGLKITGKVKYTWTTDGAGNYITKNGQIQAPKESTTFTVTLTAENNGITVTDKLTVNVKNEKVKYLGYISQDSRGAYRYYNQINVYSSSPGINTGMMDLSYLGLYGPYGFITKDKKKTPTYYYDGYRYNNGVYAVSVTGPGVEVLEYGDYGVQSFMMKKKGTYYIIYTMLDGSGAKCKYKISYK